MTPPVFGPVTIVIRFRAIYNPAPVLIHGTVVRHPGMPEFSLLEHETDGLVAYLRRVSRKWKPLP